MPYTPEHKLRTRARILEAAARLFRRDGFERTGVDALMAEAGLTRGGFYAHFTDKLDLFVHAIDAAFAQSTENLFEKRLETLAGPAWRRAATRRYLSLKHHAHASIGCAIPSLGADVARAPRRVRRLFARRIEEMIGRIAERLGGEEASRREAIALVASWVGAMVLARAVPDRRLSEEILSAVRRQWDADDDDSA